MQIPGLDRFGTDQAAPPPRSDGAGVFSTAGQGEAALGQALGGIAEQVRHTQQQERAASNALALATITNKLHDAHDQVARGVLDGSIDPDKAGGVLQTQAREAASSVTSGMNLQPFERDTMNAHITGVVGALDRNLGNVVVARKQSETGATIDQFGEQMQRQAAQIGPARASENYADLLTFAGPAAGMTPEQISKKAQAFKENTHFGFFDAAGVDAFTKHDAAGVGAVLTRVQGPEGDAIDPTKRAVLTHRLFGYQQNIIAQDQRDANAAAEAQRVRENVAIKAVNDMKDVIFAGALPSPESIKTATAAVAGTESQGELGALLAQQARFGGFATHTAAERAGIINDFRASRQDPAVGADTSSEQLLKAAVSMDEKLNAAAKENPWQAAQSAGVIPQAAAATPSSPQEAVGIMQDRMANIAKVENWAGRKVSPWQPQEAESVGKMVRMLPPDQAATFLGSMGATLGDTDRLAAFTKQIGDKDGSLGLAMSFANTQTTAGRHVAEIVLRGDQALRDGTVKVDGAKETGWKAQIATQIRGAYGNQAVEDQVVKAAFLVMAGQAKDGNADVDNAVRLATGGGVMDFNGSKIALPVGYAAEGGQSGAENRFRKEIQSIDPAQFFDQIPDGKVRVGSHEISGSSFVQSLPDAKLVTAGQGAYWVRAGNTLVSNSAGKPIVVRLPK